MNITDYVGKRVLLKVEKRWDSEVQEFKVLEVSPSKGWVKLMNLNGHKFWKPVASISFLEELKDFEQCPSETKTE